MRAATKHLSAAALAAAQEELRVTGKVVIRDAPIAEAAQVSSLAALVWGNDGSQFMPKYSLGVTSRNEVGKGVFEVNLADLNKDEDQAYRKIFLQCEEVQGHYCLTQFYGMNFTTDKLRSMVRKWQSLIEAWVDVKTTDGYVMRLFCIGFTKKRQNQLKKTCYANSSQQKLIRKKMRDIMVRESTSCELKELVNKFIPEVIGKEIEKACHGIYPLQNVAIRKVKMLKKPKFDITKLLEAHGDSGNAAVDKGTTVKTADGEEVDPLGRPVDAAPVTA